MGYERLPAALLYRCKFEKEMVSSINRYSKYISDYGYLDKSVNWCFVTLYDVCLVNSETERMLLDISQQTPLIYFLHPEDYQGGSNEELNKEYLCEYDGWGYRIYSNKKKLASVDFLYSWPTYGDLMRKHIFNSVGAAKPALFSLFDISGEELDKLHVLFDPDYMSNRLDADDSLVDVVNEFKDLLKITDYFS